MPAVVGSPVGVMGAQSRFSDCLCLSQERGLFGEWEGLSFSSDDMLENEEGRSDKKASRSCPSVKYFYPGAYRSKTKAVTLIITSTFADTTCGRLYPFSR
jgi:hypothetical protein